MGNVENQRAPADLDVGSDQEDEGQWVTQGSKQVNNRNRNKGKTENSNVNTQEASPPTTSNRKTASDNKRAAPASTSNTSSAVNNKTELDVDLPEPSAVPTAAATTTTPPVATPTPEPIEVCQLLPAGEDRYTSNDNWWKQALNKQQTFSIADIGEWPEREQDEQYTVQKRLIPVKVKALTEKDINVDGNDEINKYKNGREDEVIESLRNLVDRKCFLLEIKFR